MALRIAFSFLKAKTGTMPCLCQNLFCGPHELVRSMSIRDHFNSKNIQIQLADVIHIVEIAVVFRRNELCDGGIRTPEGIVVLSGSKLREKPVRSCPKDAKANRRKYRDLIDENHILQADILFDTPSSAAKFVLLRSANGNTKWKTKEGITLSQYEKGY